MTRSPSDIRAPADRSPRLYVEHDLSAAASVRLTAPQCHYLKNVMRLAPGAPVRLFNGRHGEWSAEIDDLGRKDGSAITRARTRAQDPLPDVHYLFAPLKQARLDYMAQKATEMGAALLQPVATQHTAVGRVKTQRLLANAVEAAEQCNLLAIPEVRAMVRLGDLLAAWDTDRRLVYCDEAAPLASPLRAMGEMAPGPLALLVGPEGGFSAQEREALRSHRAVTPISLGPRVMRADTAAVAALALLQAVRDDWA